MKLILALLVVGGILAAALLVPVGGETAWQHAQRQGLPRAALRTGMEAARGAGRWLSRAVSSAPAPDPAPPAHAAKKRVARAAAPAASATSPQGAPAGPAAPAAPAPQRDHIVAAPREQIAPSDRTALDHLISERGK